MEIEFIKKHKKFNGSPRGPGTSISFTNPNQDLVRASNEQGDNLVNYQVVLG